MDWLQSLLLGAVQGLTEFLPVSSDGHLTITQIALDRLRGRASSGAENLFFDVMLHFGTLVAVGVYYRAAVIRAVRGLLGATDVPPAYERKALLRLALLGFVACLPLVPYALGLKKLIEPTFQSLAAAGAGFLVSAAVLGLTPLIPKGDKGPAQTGLLDALLVGIAQAFAPLPGVSRSGLTIAMALARGLSPGWAVGFSLLLATPAILAANLLELKDAPLASLAADRVAQTAAATVVAGLVGYAALGWLLRIVKARRLWPFAIYLLVLGVTVLALSL